MPFLPEITPLGPSQLWPDTPWPGPYTAPRYVIQFHSAWLPEAVEPEVWADPHPVISGDLILNFDYEDGSTNGARAETPDGAARLVEADASVQNLLNLLTEALEGSDWTVGNARKTIATYQGIAPDEV